MPDQRHESHHKICNLRYGTHGYGMSACKIQSVHLLKLKVVSLVIQPILLRQYQSNHPYYC
jgi:hypothetical protein